MSKTTKTATPKTDTSTENPTKGIPLFETPPPKNGPIEITPDEVWAEVLDVSERLGIDKKMAIDLLQLTTQVNEANDKIRASISSAEVNRIIETIKPFLLEAIAKKRETDGKTSA